jgi:hypothetical protein
MRPIWPQLAANGTREACVPGFAEYAPSQKRDGLGIPAPLIACLVQRDFEALGVVRDRAFEPFESLLRAAEIMLSDPVGDAAEGKVRVEWRPISLQAFRLRSCPSLSCREE